MDTEAILRPRHGGGGEFVCLSLSIFNAGGCWWSWWWSVNERRGRRWVDLPREIAKKLIFGQNAVGSRMLRWMLVMTLIMTLWEEEVAFLRASPNEEASRKWAGE